MDFLKEFIMCTQEGHVIAQRNPILSQGVRWQRYAELVKRAKAQWFPS